MEKPIVLVIDEIKNNIVTLINESNLPLIILNPILRDIVIQCAEGEKYEIENAQKKYQAACEQDNNDHKETE